MRESKMEAYLTKRGFTWQYEPGIPLSKLDLQASLPPANKGRLRGLHDDTVQEYALSMEDGCEFPAIVVLKLPTGRYLIATGCHRLAAAELLDGKVKTLDAYVVTEDDDQQRENLVRELNTIEGRAPDRQERLAHIIHMHRTYREPIEQLAKRYHVPAETARTAVRAEQVSERGKTLGVELRQQTTTTRVELGKLRSDVVFKAASELVLAADLRTDTVKQFIKDLQGAEHTETAQLAVVKKWRARPEVARALTVKDDPRRSRQPAFYLIGGRLNTLLSTHATVESLGMTSPALRQQAAVLARDLITRLGRLQQTLQLDPTVRREAANG